MSDGGGAARAVELLRLVGITDAERRLEPISAPALRRHAPARDDRHRPRLQSEAHHRRRADHGARRHHPGADPRADEATCRARLGIALIVITHNLGIVARYADRVTSCMPAASSSRRAADALFRGPRHPYTIGPAALDPAARPAARRAARDHRGPAARSARSAAGLPLRAALPVRARALRRAPRRCAEVGPGHAPPASARPMSRPAADAANAEIAARRRRVVTAPSRCSRSRT